MVMFQHVAGMAMVRPLEDSCKEKSPERVQIKRCIRLTWETRVKGTVGLRPMSLKVSCYNVPSIVSSKMQNVYSRFSFFWTRILLTHNSMFCNLICADFKFL